MPSRPPKAPDEPVATDEWGRVGRSRQSLNHVVADELRKAILAGRFKPGDRLPEPQLAEIFGVSRNPIREALQVLSNEGLVEISRGRGARIPEVMPDEFLEMIELRADLEGLNARNAARHCTAETRSLIEGLLAEGNAALASDDMAALERANARYHRELWPLGRNRYLTEFLGSLRDRTFWLVSTKAKVRADVSWREHARVLEAILSGDEALAGRLATEHVSQVGQSLVNDLSFERKTSD